jgi:replicative DNA helicase
VTTPDEADTYGPDPLQPNDPQAEQVVLGAMMTSPDAIGAVLGVYGNANPRDLYYRTQHATIHDSIAALYEAGQPVDPMTVTQHLRERGDLNVVGGPVYLMDCYAAVPTASNAGYYAGIVLDLWHRRQAIGVAQSVLERVRRGFPGSGKALLEYLESEAAARAPRDAVQDYQQLGGLIEDAVDEMETIATTDGRTHGVPTGIMDLDELTNGLQPGQMVIVAGRPAMGKSTLGMDFARAAAIKGYPDGTKVPTVFFSLEMGRTELTMRLLSAEAKVALHHMRTGAMTDEDWNRVAARMREVSEAPLFIDDTPSITMAQIRAKCRRLKARHGLGLVIFDYLQLSPGSRPENRQQEVSEISRSCKVLAKELGAPVVAVCQLNRGPEQRSDKKPLMSDLRESGSLEQDADLVLLLHREDAYEKESPRAGEADIIVAKHRNGPTGVVTVAFQGHYSRFVDMAR